eukprot:4131264-Amphidinium_carterae.1
MDMSSTKLVAPVSTGGREVSNVGGTCQQCPLATMLQFVHADFSPWHGQCMTEVESQDIFVQTPCQPCSRA